jgi:hypothetical protein
MTIHDFSFENRYWGNNFQLLNKKDDRGLLWEIAGWKRGVEKGHILSLGINKDRKPPYKVIKIEYCGNPSDMFFATVKYIGTNPSPERV